MRRRGGGGGKGALWFIRDLVSLSLICIYTYTYHDKFMYKVYYILLYHRSFIMVYYLSIISHIIYYCMLCT
jgi:hypothetical protein